MQKKSSTRGQTSFAEDDMIYNRDLFTSKYAVADLLKIHKDHLMTIKY